MMGRHGLHIMIAEHVRVVPRQRRADPLEFRDPNFLFGEFSFPDEIDSALTSGPGSERRPGHGVTHLKQEGPIAGSNATRSSGTGRLRAILITDHERCVLEGV